MFPKTVPILETKDMCKGRYNDGNKCCLVGHSNKFVLENRKEIQKSLKKVIKEELGNSFGTDNYLAANIVLFNDNKKNTKPLLARVWNRAMFLLGYTVGNPEKKPLRKS